MAWCTGVPVEMGQVLSPRHEARICRRRYGIGAKNKLARRAGASEHEAAQAGWMGKQTDSEKCAALALARSSHRHLGKGRRLRLAVRVVAAAAAACRNRRAGRHGWQLYCAAAAAAGGPPRAAALAALANQVGGLANHVARQLVPVRQARHASKQSELLRVMQASKVSCWKTLLPC